VQVSEIGLKSLSIFFGGVTLGIGLTMEDFRGNGIFPSFRDWLYISCITGASSKAISFNNLFGILSGPTALLIFIEDNA
jgi:hypothetical protein